MLACQYPELDPYGFCIGAIAFLLACLYGYHLLAKFNLNRPVILNVFLLSAIGHFVGAFAYFESAIRNGADSCMYFQYATLKYHGTGYFFAFLILGYAKKYLLGESFLAAFLISGAIGLITSTYLAITYKMLLDKISQHRPPHYFYDVKQLTYPITLLFCWPSYFFWSAGLIKDNFAFLAITITLFTVVKGKINFSDVIAVIIAAALGFMVRPYLIIIFGMSTFIYIIMNSKLKPSYKIIIFCIFGGALSVLWPLLNDYAKLAHFESGSATLKAVGEYAVRQQDYMAIGSSIPVPTHNPYLTFLFIPWLFFASLLLPLGFGASNLIGLVSSIENFYLLYWIVWFVKYRRYWRDLAGKFRILKFLMAYFFIGMTCLSIMSTNLGAAMREKMMCVPALLICMFLTYAYRRILVIDFHMEQQQNSLNTIATS